MNSGLRFALLGDGAFETVPAFEVIRPATGLVFDINPGLADGVADLLCPLVDIPPDDDFLNVPRAFLDHGLFVPLDDLELALLRYLSA